MPICGIAVFGSEHQNRWWWTAFQRWYSVLRGCDAVYYYCLYRWVRRPHTIKLDPTYNWIDADKRIFQAFFMILGGFVEDELG